MTYTPIVTKTLSLLKVAFIVLVSVICVRLVLIYFGFVGHVPVVDPLINYLSNKGHIILIKSAEVVFGRIRH